MVSNRSGCEELVSTSGVFAVGATAGFQRMDVIFKLFGRLMVEAEGVAGVVRNDVFPVCDTVRTHKKRGDVVRKRLVTNARLAEVDHGSGDANRDQIHLSN